MNIWDDDDDGDYVPHSHDHYHDEREIEETEGAPRAMVLEDEDDDDDDDDAYGQLDDELPRPRTSGVTALSSLDFFRLISSQPALLSLFTDARRTATQARRPGTLREEETDSLDDVRDPAGWSRDKGGFKDCKIPNPKGVALLRSGEFGRIGSLSHDPGIRIDKDEEGSNGRKPHSSVSLYGLWKTRQTCTKSAYQDDFTRYLVPNSHGSVVARYDLDANAYSGQFSADSSFYYTCCQDFRLHIYDTTAPPQTVQYIDQSHKTTMKVLKTVDGVPGSWTITDSHLSPDNERLIYSSITSTVYMAKTHDPTNEQIPIHFGDTTGSRWQSDYFGIYSCRFSTDGKEIVAGGNGQLLVYDLGAMRRSINIKAHHEDVNSCCWADENSGNVLVSASDDTTLKVWDRRSLGASHKPSGVLIGHTEGITHVSPRGDGRYIISNGKDQILRLWDLRKMSTPHEWAQVQGEGYGHSGWDYRRGRYPKPRHFAHPKDTSVMNYRGHSVLRTLIRCHFSPAHTTGNSYIASGSADGKIHIWSLDGRVIQVLDRSKTQPIDVDPSAADPSPGTSEDQTSASSRYSRNYRESYYDSPSSTVVRDIAWHGYEPVLMSCAWGSTIARHEWKGLGKNGMTMQDVVERDEATESSRTRPGRVL